MPDKTNVFDLSSLEKENQESLSRLIVDVLTMDNLVVLTGSGTSLNEEGSLGPSMSALWTNVKSKAGDKTFAKILKEVKYATPLGGSDNIEDLLSLCHLYLQITASDELKSFVKLAEELIVKECSFVNDSTPLDSHISFLQRVARRSVRLSRLKLFTTNYDLCFEEAARKSRFILVDGFGHSLPQTFDNDTFNIDFVRREAHSQQIDYVSNVFHLFKMHGSVDWDNTVHGTIRRSPPEMPAMIYPRNSKYQLSYNQPFFEMMSRFQGSLRSPNTGLLILGFGFNDDHISQPILAALASNVNLKVLIVSRNCQEGHTKNPVIQKLQSISKTQDPRLTLVKGDFSQFVLQIPDLVRATEDEKHKERVKILFEK